MNFEHKQAGDATPSLAMSELMGWWETVNSGQ